jgi:hypothetical protein
MPNQRSFFLTSVYKTVAQKLSFSNILRTFEKLLFFICSKTLNKILQMPSCKKINMLSNQNQILNKHII